jgi:hypothetical protein
MGADNDSQPPHRVRDNIPAAQSRRLIGPTYRLDQEHPAPGRRGMGFRRHMLGGFGGLVPEPSSGGHIG